MKLMFYEKKAWGYADECLVASLDDLRTCRLPKPWEDARGEATKPVRERRSISVVAEEGVAAGELRDRYLLDGSPIPETVDSETDTVTFEVPSSIGDTGVEEYAIYWIPGAGSWIAFSEYAYMEHSHAGPWADGHRGPFRVEGALAGKLLEAFGIGKGKVPDGDIASLGPDRLERLAQAPEGGRS
jgi:hypothetical protein